MLPEIVIEEEEIFRLPCFEHCQYELHYGVEVGVDEPGLDMVSLDPALHRDASHDGHGCLLWEHSLYSL